MVSAALCAATLTESVAGEEVVSDSDGLGGDAAGRRGPGPGGPTGGSDGTCGAELAPESLVALFAATYRPPFFCHWAKTGLKQSRAWRRRSAARRIKASACWLSRSASSGELARRACSLRVPAWLINGRASSNRSQQEPNSGAEGACGRQVASCVHALVSAM